MGTRRREYVEAFSKINLRIFCTKYVYFFVGKIFRARLTQKRGRNSEYLGIEIAFVSFFFVEK